MFNVSRKTADNEFVSINSIKDVEVDDSLFLLKSVDEETFNHIKSEFEKRGFQLIQREEYEYSVRYWITVDKIKDFFG